MQTFCSLEEQFNRGGYRPTGPIGGPQRGPPLRYSPYPSSFPPPPPPGPPPIMHAPIRGAWPSEHRIVVDLTAFPPEMNVIAQILGPRGRHQQRMKNESDAVVTMIGKGVRGAIQPEEPMTILVKSKNQGQPLTKRQIAAVQAIYEELIAHVRQFGTTDGVGVVAFPNTGPPENILEFLWFIHRLLIVPRVSLFVSGNA